MRSVTLPPNWQLDSLRKNKKKYQITLLRLDGGYWTGVSVVGEDCDPNLAYAKAVDKAWKLEA